MTAVPIPKQARSAPTKAKSPLRPSWRAWFGGVVAACFIGLADNADARTDFERMEQLAATRRYEQEPIRYGHNAAAAVALVKAWRAMIENAQTLPDARKKLSLTNDFTNNHILYASDRDIWKVEDYWTTPLELFIKGAGDCEDYAITKYITLLMMDVPAQKLRLVYVRARMGRLRTVAHMVLSYYETPTSDPLILDNLTDEIFTAAERPDLYPVFSFNHEGLWMEGERSSSGDPTSRLSHWRNVLQRMRNEGIDPSLTTLSARSILSWKRLKSNPLARKADNSRFSSNKAAKPPVRAKVAKSVGSAKVVKAKKRASSRSALTTLKAKTAKSLPRLRKKGR